MTKPMIRATTIAIALIVLGSPHPRAQTPMPFVPFQGFDDSGNPVTTGKLCTYVSGSTTPATTYSDRALSVANAVPPTGLTLDGAGRANVFLVSGQSYKFVLKSSGAADCNSGTTIWSIDGVGAIPSAAGNVDELGTAGEALTAGQAVYLSDGSGAKAAGQWFKASSDNDYSSSQAQTGIVPNSIASGSAGTIRIAGQATGLSGLTIGTTYFVASASGTTTATAPNNIRMLGVADSTTTLVMVPALPTKALAIDNALDDFRLTATTATCVTTSDVTAAVTIFFTPCKGNRIALYDASGNPTIYTSAQISIAVPATTSQMYGVFVYASAGNPTLELTAWTNDTTPGAAAIVNTVAPGSWTKSGDATRRFVGVMRTTTVAGQTESSLAKRYLQNQYNRVRLPMRVTDTTDTWAYSTATIRQARASAANQLDFIVGVADVAVDATVRVSWSNSAAGFSSGVGIGLDTTGTFDTNALKSLVTSPVANYNVTLSAFEVLYPAVGRHFLAWLEIGSGSPVDTFVGDNGGANFAAGIQGFIEG